MGTASNINISGFGKYKFNPIQIPGQSIGWKVRTTSASLNFCQVRIIQLTATMGPETKLDLRIDCGGLLPIRDW
jgi:hypothetical protein